MHLISEVSIENYCSIRSGRFPLTAYTPLVGYNNAGKTNVLRALSWLMKKYSLAASDFFDAESPVVVEAVLSGITDGVLATIEEKHRAKIQEFVSGEKLKIRRVQAKPNAKTAEISFEIAIAGEAADQKWVPNPTGIDNAIMKLFPEHIFIGAMENASEDVGKFGTSTTIGKLMRAIIAPVIEAHSGSVEAALAGVASKLSANSEEKDQNLINLDTRMQNEIEKFFPGVSVRTHIETPEFSDFLKGATVKIFEGDPSATIGRDASSFGHGAQRSVQIALIKCLADIERGEVAGRTTLLLIDEPELYLHPQAVELVRSSLKKLASEGYQVILTTHSANMITRDDAANALLIRRDSTDGTVAYPRIEETVRAAIIGEDHQSATLFDLTNSSKILFSEKAVLAEGKTEKAVLPDLFKFATTKTLDEERLGLVDLGGSSNVPGAMNVLNTMNVPVKSIVDLDFAFKVATKFGLIEEHHASIVACKAIFQILEGAGQCLLGDDGLPRNPKKNETGLSAAEAFELLAKQGDAGDHIEILHNALKENGIWLWKLGAIEAHLGLPGKTSGDHRIFIQSLTKTDALDEIPDRGGVVEMLEWIRS